MQCIHKVLSVLFAVSSMKCVACSRAYQAKKSYAEHKLSLKSDVLPSRAKTGQAQNDLTKAELAC